MTSGLGAGALVAAAVLLVAGRRPGLRSRRRRRPPAAPYALAGGAILAGVVVGDEPRVAVFVAIVGAAGLLAARLVVRHRADRGAAAVRVRVVELCATLHAELAAGQGAAEALARAAGDWPLLGPVVRTAATGGDVPSALRDLTSVPGAGDLRVVAAAWQVAHRTGHGLADAVARVAEELRGAEQTRRVVTGELASARATARLVAGLPVVALLMGSGAGANPWAFLLGHPLGLACLGGGLGFALAGLAWIEALARDVERGR